MQRKKQTPGTVLNTLIKKHGLNYSSLAKAIGLSGAMVRLIALDENPVSAAVAFRLAAFFKTSPDYWLTLQSAFDIARTAKDKKLAKVLKTIPTVDKAKKAAKPGRKPKAKKTTKKTARKTKTTANKTAGKRGRKRTAGASAKTASVRAARAKPKAKRVKVKVQRPKAAPVNQSNEAVNEPALW